MRQRCLASLILALGATTPALAVLNDYATCVLVPFLFYENEGDDQSTTVGLKSLASGRIYWQFYDRDGNRRFEDDFSQNGGSFTPVVWSAEAPDSLENNPGYGLFCLDTNGDGLISISDQRALAANAFLLQEEGGSDDDVAFIPTLGLNAGNLFGLDPEGWRTNPITSLPRGISSNGLLEIQYLINDGDDDRTRVFIWTTRYPGEVTMDLIDPEGNDQGDLSLSFMEDNLTVFDLSVSGGFPQGSGFLRWDLPFVSGLQSFAFSIVRSEDFGASQTLLGHGRNP